MSSMLSESLRRNVSDEHLTCLVSSHLHHSSMCIGRRCDEGTVLCVKRNVSLSAT